MKPADALFEGRRIDFETNLISTILPTNNGSIVVDTTPIVRHQMWARHSGCLPQRRNIRCDTARATLAAVDFART